MAEQKSLSVKALRRSAAELLACALRELFPQSLLVKAGVSNAGFHYDFALSQPLDDQALTLVEEHMRSIVRDARPVRSLEMLRTNAIQFFLHHKQSLKAEYLETLDEGTVELFQMGEFQDVCQAPHISNSRELSAFKLLSIAPITILLPEGDVEGWRISGTACSDRAELKNFLKQLDRSKEQDHRLLGATLDLYSSPPDLGPGLWMWHPKGTLLRDQLLHWWKEAHQKQGFQFVTTPTLMRKKLFHSSSVNEKIDFTLNVQGLDYLLVPTHVPAHVLIFQQQHAQHKLPLRYAEVGETYQSEEQEEDEGLFSACNQWVDEAQIYCLRDQLSAELISSLQFIDRTIKMFGFKSRAYLCNLRGKSPADTTMTAAQRKQSQQQLVQALQSSGIEYLIDEESQPGYGWMASDPRVEIRVLDSLNREWSGSYVAVDRVQSQDYMVIHRSLFGSLERFIALLVEQYAGFFPLWLAPEQVRVIPVTDKQIPYAEAIRLRLASYAIRATVECHRETKQGEDQNSLRSKIRCAQLAKVPYALVVGDKEEEKGTITVRPWNQQQLYTVALEDWIKQLLDEISTKAPRIGNLGE